MDGYRHCPKCDCLRPRNEKACEWCVVAEKQARKNRWLCWIACSVIVAITLVAAIVCIEGIPHTYSTGDRVGVITKLSRKGLLCKTWEAEANVGSASVPGVGSVWAFSVPEAMVAEADAAVRSGARVRISYREALVRGARYGETPYLVERISEERAK